MGWSADIDEAFASLAGNLTAFMDLAGTYEDGARTQRLRATRIEIETPIELDLRTADGGVAALGTAPPIYHAETGIMPVFHTLRITLVPVGELAEHTSTTPVDPRGGAA
ncbi:hypothetical protein [Thetidibacter halocola]|uniref:Uncharacterized protein n=1 Tax=Thetidibacter halocola TaxID=2827239 RepID=A0A8J8B814_9RHOB|nr:hypothetical protein [Thetidibacter halocola]MBS0124997.1 hypothetical protein [Thetidibacter halocola]